MEHISPAPFSLDFNLMTGMCDSGKEKATDRFVSNMIAQFHDREAAQRIIDDGDDKLYSFYELDYIPEIGSDLRFGTSIVYPGKVGDEYYMTKGHFHTLLETAEVYYCLAGEGYMLMETPEGDINLQELKPGVALYVPPRWAHRSINTGKENMVTFFVFRSDAGHDYGTIEQKGYRKILIDKDGVPTLIDNPRWTKG